MNDYNKLHSCLAESNEASARAVVPVVYDLTAPASVIDVGCGDGTWLSTFRQLGVDDVLGLDGDYIDPNSLKIPKSCFQAIDLTGNLIPTRQFDLAVCLEVGEHLPTEKSESLVKFLTKSAPVVLFSAAIPGQGGVNHVNEQWQSFWVHNFHNCGFEVYDVLRPKFWEDCQIAYYYAQNMFLFLRKDAVQDFPKIIVAMSNRNTMIDVMHPVRAERLRVSNIQHQTVTIRQGAAAVYRGLYRRFFKR
jgi:SAM-dependent methyltransferase